MSLSALSFPYVQSGLPGIVFIKFKDKIVKMMVDNPFWIETDADTALMRFEESFLQFPDKNVGTTSDGYKVGLGFRARYNRVVAFKFDRYPVANVYKPPLVELVVKDTEK